MAASLIGPPLSDATHPERPRSNGAKYLAGWNRARNKPFPTQAETAHHLAAFFSQITRDLSNPPPATAHQTASHHFIRHLLNLRHVVVVNGLLTAQGSYDLVAANF
jgi:hypothetical protein